MLTPNGPTAGEVAAAMLSVNGEHRAGLKVVIGDVIP